MYRNFWLTTGAIASKNDVLMCNDSKFIIGEIINMNKSFSEGIALFHSGWLTAYRYFQSFMHKQMTSAYTQLPTTEVYY